MSNPAKKLFVVKKYIMAANIAEAIRLDKKTKPQDVWIDDDWKKNNAENLDSGNMGFSKPKQ